MSALYYLIPAALLIVGAILWLFAWAVNSGQYDDLDSPGRRLLMDEDTDPQRSREAPDD